MAEAWTEEAEDAHARVLLFRFVAFFCWLLGFSCCMGAPRSQSFPLWVSRSLSSSLGCCSSFSFISSCSLSSSFRRFGSIVLSLHLVLRLLTSEQFFHVLQLQAVRSASVLQFHFAAPGCSIETHHLAALPIQLLRFEAMQLDASAE